MKHFVSAVLLVMFVAISFACSGDKQAASESTTQKTEPKGNVTVAQLSTDIDPVCGMKLTDESIYGTTKYDGKTYGFCGAGCKEKFDTNPTAFANATDEHQGDKTHDHNHM